MNAMLRIPVLGTEETYVLTLMGRVWLLMGLLLIGFGTVSMAQGVVTVQIEDFTLRLSAESASPEEGTVTMCPNPATDRVTITPSAGTHIDYFEIVSIATGTIVFTTSVAAPASYQVALASGSYLFKVENDLGQLLQEQIVIQRAP